MEAEQELAPDDGEALQINRALLLRGLRAIAEAASIGAARAAAAQLAQTIGDAGAPLRQVDDGEESFECSAAYLRGELGQISAALTIDRARYYADRLVRAVVEERRSPLNDINLNRWKEREYDDLQTDSLWLIDRRDSTGVHSADYWGNFVPQIPNQIMRRYTRRGEWVLDLFAGLGTTLIEGQRLGRNTLGVELQPSVAARARTLLDQEPNPHEVVRAIVEGDSATVDLRAALAAHGCSSVQLLMLHPPYHDIIKFSEDPRDLSNSRSVEAFVAGLTQIVRNAAPLLDRGRMMALVIGDKYARGDWIPLGFLAMQAVQEQGFALKSIVVKNVDGTAGKRARRELWRYRALAGGFYVFRHEYLFVFRKR